MMGKARDFRELEAKMSPESRARVAERVAETLAKMPLDELRRAREKEFGPQMNTDKHG